ncbi:MAG: tryptophan-rich sensory protein [Verrucomicrobia bacterium]|nr:MAG: tryptophan-rich sensory protein [Verrucomicrobiota bacterium]
MAAFSAAGLGGLATADGMSDWYRALVKPAWTPPSWLFGPVWTVLYLAMTIVGWRIWRLPTADSGVAKRQREILILWWVQLGFNAAWSWAFFYFKSPAAGLLVIGALSVTIAWIQPRLAALDRPSALLWTPYVLWVGFASVLNLALWDLN